jgi:hypothetical protein
MSEVNAAPLFPQPVVFPDVDAAILAREDCPLPADRQPARSGAWQNYMLRTLPPRVSTKSATAS